MLCPAVSYHTRATPRLFYSPFLEKTWTTSRKYLTIRNILPAIKGEECPDISSKLLLFLFSSFAAIISGALQWCRGKRVKTRAIPPWLVSTIQLHSHRYYFLSLFSSFHFLLHQLMSTSFRLFYQINFNKETMNGVFFRSSFELRHESPMEHISALLVIVLGFNGKSNLT